MVLCTHPPMHDMRRARKWHIIGEIWAGFIAKIWFWYPSQSIQDSHIRKEGNSLYAISGRKYLVNWIFFPPSVSNGKCGFNTSKFSMGKCLTDLKWITGKTSIIWGWPVWKQGTAAFQPDHNSLLWKNQESRQSPNLGRAAGMTHWLCWTRLCCQTMSPRVQNLQLTSWETGSTQGQSEPRSSRWGEWRYWATLRACCLVGGVTLGENMRNLL